MSVKVAKNRISLAKIQRYKELKLQQALIETELKELKQYIESRLDVIGLDDIVIDCYKIRRTVYPQDFLDQKQLREDEPYIWNIYATTKNITRLNVK